MKLLYICLTFLKRTMGKISIIFLLLTTSIVVANNPNTDDLDKLNKALPTVKESYKKMNNVNAKEVKEVFMKKKRIDKIFKPKKRLSKLKYTIA